MACTILGRTVCKSMVAFLLSSHKTAKLKITRRSPRRCSAHALEAGIVIAGVIINVGRVRRGAAADEATGASIARARSLDRVFAVEAAGLAGQQALAIAEHHAVLGMRKRTAGEHEPVGFL